VRVEKSGGSINPDGSYYNPRYLLINDFSFHSIILDAPHEFIHDVYRNMVFCGEGTAFRCTSMLRTE